MRQVVNTMSLHFIYHHIFSVLPRTFSELLRPLILPCRIIVIYLPISSLSWSLIHLSVHPPFHSLDPTLPQTVASTIPCPLLGLSTHSMDEWMNSLSKTLPDGRDPGPHTQACLHGPNKIRQGFSVDLSLYQKWLEHEGKAITFSRVQMRLVLFYDYLKEDF